MAIPVANRGGNFNQQVAAVGRRVMTLCKHEAGLRQQLALYQAY
jgi:hypothetical protein